MSGLLQDRRSQHPLSLKRTTFSALLSYPNKPTSQIRCLLQRLRPADLTHAPSASPRDPTPASYFTAAPAAPDDRTPGPQLDAFIDPLDGLRPARFNLQSFGSVVWAFSKLDWATDVLPRLAHVALNARARYYAAHGADAPPFFHVEAPSATMPIMAFAQIASGPEQPRVCRDLMEAIAEDAAAEAERLSSRVRCFLLLF